MKPKGRKVRGSRSHAASRSPAPAVFHGTQQCPIVGIGASAGGLEAFTLLLKQLPFDTGFGFVLVQHLDPQHESALRELLGRATSMPVHEVTNNLRVEANHVYIIPPNTGLGISRGVLKLQPRSPGRLAPRSIDFFFEALAKDQRERAIGVILSGAATDGTLGLEAIKAEGGFTFAQDGSAKYDSMPRSAVSAGCVDLILPPAGIAKELARIARHPSVANHVRDRDTPLAAHGIRIKATSGKRAGIAPTLEAVPPAENSAGQSGYKQVLLLLRNHCGVDFSLYKAATILRRITRRTVLNRQETLEKYAGYLRGNVKELDALYSDALISVTSFFRNAGAFEVLKSKVFAPLLSQPDDEPIRVWVLGCSTGQEPYSIAMAFIEAAEKIPRARKLQLFATDLNEANLEKARHGLYAKSVVQDVSPERLRRFFTEEENDYRVIKSLREMVVFARQNIISDPPFSRMDLISCRNLMIYLEPSLQKKVLPAFHYALKPDGFLFLGASESIGSLGSLFLPIDKKEKIFSRKSAPLQAFQLPVKKAHAPRSLPGRTSRTSLSVAKNASAAPEALRTELSAEREADRITVKQFAPPGVLINHELQILQFRGATGAYLEPPTGKASFDLLKMAREGLMLPLRSTINQAKKENKSIRRENIAVSQDGRTRGVNVEVLPLKNLKECCFLVLFEESEKKSPAPVDAARQAPVNTLKNGPSVGRKEESIRVTELEHLLAETRDYLQSIQEHQDGANEELQASNEESQSANEELQSLNEELETSKEELESTNEELTTVNEEMVTRNTELNRLNSDLNNLQSSTKLAIVLLGRDLAIRRFSVQAEKKLHLVASDLGRPINAIRHNLDLPELAAILGDAVANGRECEREVRDKDGRWYSLRVRPYLTGETQIDGAVLVLVDIDDLKRTERLIVEEHEHAEAIIRTVPNPLVILTADLLVQSANEAFYRMFKVSAKETQGHPFLKFDHGAWNIPRLRLLLEDIVPKNSWFNDFEVSHHFSQIGRRSLLLNARRLDKSGDGPKGILLGLHDITESLALQNDLQRSEQRYRRLFETAQDGILILDPETRKITDANPFIVKLLGYSRKQLLTKELWQIGLLKDEAANQEAFRVLKTKGYIRYEDLPLKAKNGRHHEVEFVSSLYDEAGEEVIQCNIRDITERKRTETALIASETRFRILFDMGPIGVYSCDASGLIQEFNRQAAKLWGRKPKLTDRRDRFCGSFKMYFPDGTVMPHRSCPMAHVLSGQIAGVQDAEVVIERPDASRITVIANIVPLKNTEGRITGAINCFYDISDRKKAENALVQARKQLALHAGRLEELVVKRTEELTATNRHLQSSLISVGKGQRQNRLLLDESEAMQKKLRKLTHQIIAAQEEERKEISRELHDEVVQLLVGVNVELSALAKGSTASIDEVRRKIAHIQRLVEESVSAVHRFARQLRPAILDDLGLIPALHAYCKSLADRKKIKINLTAFGGVESLGISERTVLFRVAQEALNNVIRHAHASLVTISITKIPGAVQMEVIDNGKAFNVKNSLRTGNKRLGLIGMKERVEMVGGKLTLESVPGRGTTVRTEIPFPSPNKKHALSH